MMMLDAVMIFIFAKLLDVKNFSFENFLVKIFLNKYFILSFDRFNKYF
jgi:hypothetical protein